MLNIVDKNIFLNSESVKMIPVVSAEWNQNLFNAPYLVVAGNGTDHGLSDYSGVSTNNNESVTLVNDSTANTHFTTYSFPVHNTGSAHVSYTASSLNSSASYKVVTYVKTDNPYPLMFTLYGNGLDVSNNPVKTQYGSTQVEVNNYNWVKVEMVIGGSSASDIISKLNFTLSCNMITSYDVSTINFYFTKPEVYENTYFDYVNHSLYDPYSVFNFLRPGESFVTTGNANFNLPDSHREFTHAGDVVDGVSNYYSPVTSIVQNPSSIVASAPVPNYKHVVPTHISTYKYFVSDPGNTYITAKYQTSINSNKLIVKVNNMITTPTINLAINGTTISVDGSINISVPSNGVLILYWNGTAWTKSKWSTMPQFNPYTGNLSTYTSINQITMSQVSSPLNDYFSSYTGSNANFMDDSSRLHLVEISPRLEIDISNFVQDIDVNKALDTKSTVVPLSTINPSDCKIVLSGIPAFTGSTVLPIFANDSNKTSTILASMLRKNVKFYTFANLFYYDNPSYNPSNTLIPLGVFYSDTWDEKDIDAIDVQGYDIIRYLQTMPVSDYVASLKSVYELISTLLDLSGYTDYDMDSLYEVTNDPTVPMDLAYFYCNSQDTTIVSALNELMLSYQIGAYIDEYNVMRFLSLSKILSKSNSSTITISDTNIVENGFNTSNSSKVGKIQIRYSPPKILQSFAMQNATDPAVRQSPSFVYTTSNDILWRQDNSDSVGFNHLAATMNPNDNYFQLYPRDILDIFHTYQLNNHGYAVIEDEIVSFVYKDYILSGGSGPIHVSVKNDLELAAEINKYVKKYKVALSTNSTDTTQKADYNVTVTPTAKITNVQRGMFGTAPALHTVITSLASKNLSQGVVSGSSISSGSGATVSQNESTNPNQIETIEITAPANEKVIVYPTSERDLGYKTYSTKFNFTSSASKVACGGLFFNAASTSSTSGAYFVELIRLNSTPTAATASYVYIMVVYNNSEVVAWADVTGEMGYIYKNFPVVLQTASSGTKKYNPTIDDALHLKVAHYTSDGSDGENAGEVLAVFLNNIEIKAWSIPSVSSTGVNGIGIAGWGVQKINSVTGVRQRITLPTSLSTGTVFGAYMSTKPPTISNFIYPATETSTQVVGYIREIYANQKSLLEKSVNYWYQDIEFLNGLVQKRNIFNKYLSYMMQTTPEVVGINVYDVQYQTPAATTAEAMPVRYTWQYFPGNDVTDQQYLQTQVIDQYALAYSSILNTGYRGVWAIANNSSQMIYISKKADDLNQFNLTFTVYTREIAAPSDPSILEKVIDYTNTTEVAQIDSNWLQSEVAAQRMLTTIAQAIEGFSKDVSLNIFANPLIQVGDIITLNYKLKGVNQRRYVVQGIKHSFKDGWDTVLTLNQVYAGNSY